MSDIYQLSYNYGQALQSYHDAIQRAEAADKAIRPAQIAMEAARDALTDHAIEQAQVAHGTQKEAAK